MTDNFIKPGKFGVRLPVPQHPGQGFNRGRYNNPQVDRLLEAGVKETDQAKVKAIYSEYQKKLVDDAPVIFVYSNLYTDFVNSIMKSVVNFPGAGADYGYVYPWYVAK